MDSDKKEYRKLYRSTDNRIISGVCGGMGEYFGIDPNIIRLIFAALALVGGAGVFIYIFASVILPKKPD